MTRNVVDALLVALFTWPRAFRRAAGRHARRARKGWRLLRLCAADLIRDDAGDFAIEGRVAAARWSARALPPPPPENFGYNPWDSGVWLLPARNA